MKLKAWITFALLFALACNKADFNSNTLAGIDFSVDAVHFDTLIAGLASHVQTVKIFNNSNDEIRFNKVELASGEVSRFSINLHGRQGSNFRDIIIPSKDSIYLFISVNPLNVEEDDIYILKDSISFSWNQQNKVLALEAYAQPVIIYKDTTITTDLSLEANRSYFIQGSLIVSENTFLEIPEGVKIYFYPGADIQVHGRISSQGTAEKPVVFTTYRKAQPTAGSWEGIKLFATHQDHEFHYTTIEYARNAISFESDELSNSKLNMTASKIISSTGYGLKLKNTGLSLRNCEITNNNVNLYINGGGNYYIQNATFATYSSMTALHLNPGVVVSDTYKQNGADISLELNVTIVNSIIWGDLMNELFFEKKNNESAFSIRYSIYKSSSSNSEVVFNESFTTDPEFVEIDISKKIFNFKLSPFSPAINKGLFISSDRDITGAERTDGLPDLGCYEYFSSEL